MRVRYGRRKTTTTLVDLRRRQRRCSHLFVLGIGPKGPIPVCWVSVLVVAAETYFFGVREGGWGMMGHWICVCTRRNWAVAGAIVQATIAGCGRGVGSYFKEGNDDRVVCGKFPGKWKISQTICTLC